MLRPVDTCLLEDDGRKKGTNLRIDGSRSVAVTNLGRVAPLQPIPAVLRDREQIRGHTKLSLVQLWLQHDDLARCGS